MNSEFRDKWHRVHETFAGHLRPWAKVIRDHGQFDYQLLGHLFDFGQLCVMFPALLVLARAFHDGQFRQVFFQSADPSDLERASFGTWLGFLRDALRRLRQRGAELPFPEIFGFYESAVPSIGSYVVPVRNRTSHSLVTKRFHVGEEEIGRLSDVLLDVAVATPRLFSQELARVGGTVAFPVDSSASRVSTVPLDPFVIPGGNGEEVLLYESLGANFALFSSAYRSVRRPDLAATIKHYLRSAGPPREVKPLRKVTGIELLDGSAALVRDFCARLRHDAFSTEWFFSELPPLAGRPAWGEHLLETLKTAGHSAVYHLYGPRGTGKRRLLADLVSELAGQELVVVPLLTAKLPAGSLLAAFNRAMHLDGTVRELSAAVQHKAPAARLILAMDGVSPLLASQERSRELTEFIHTVEQLENTSFVFLSDGVEKIPLPSTSGGRLVQLPVPPLENEACEQFYASVTIHPGHAPLGEWRQLPEAARRAARRPCQVVHLCRKFDARPVPEAFDECDDREATWNEEVLGEPERLTVVRDVAQSALQARRREVPLETCPSLESTDRALRKAREDLLALGILTESLLPEGAEHAYAVSFLEYDWLARALMLTPPLSGLRRDCPDEHLRRLFAECDAFTPLGDALALWADQHSTEEIAWLLDRVLDHKPDRRGWLIEALLARAYAYPELLDGLVGEVVSRGDEAALRGCAAAAQQMIDDGGGEAVRAGGEVYARLLQTCREKGFEALEATLLNEYALHGLTDRFPDRQRECFARAAKIAERLDLVDLALVASNNRASVDVDVACGKQSTDSSGARHLAEQVVDRLIPYREVAPTAKNWRHLRDACQLLARAHALLSSERRGDARPLLEQAVGLCRQFGEGLDLALAQDALACWLADQGEFDAALGYHEHAIGGMRIGGDRLGEAGCLAHRGLTRRRQFDAAPSTPRQTLAEGYNDCRRAKRILERLPETLRVCRTLGEAWSHMAGLVERMGAAGQAMAAAREAILWFEKSGDKAEVDALEGYLQYLQGRYADNQSR